MIAIGSEFELKTSWMDWQKIEPQRNNVRDGYSEQIPGMYPILQHAKANLKLFQTKKKDPRETQLGSKQ